MSDLDPQRGLLKAIRSAINSHGYGLQAACFASAADVRVNRPSDRASRWVCEGLEVPFSIPGRNGRVDAVFRHTNNRCYITTEFKRVNAALSRWVFAKMPLIKRNRSREYLLADSFIFHEASGRASVQGYKLFDLSDAYHVGVVARGGDSGENEGQQSRGAIEEAATQACAGASGLLQHWAAGRGLKPADRAGVYVIPVIVTTAELYSVKPELTVASIETGDIELSDDDIKPEKWLYYQYPTSPGLRAPIAGSEPQSADLLRMLDMAYLRTIPVVRATAFDEWLVAGQAWDYMEPQKAGIEA